MKKIYSSPEEIYEDLQQSIRHVVPKSVVPDFELKQKSELLFEINNLAKEKNAIILKHNYMEPILYYGVHGYKGDSLELSRKAAEAKSDIIVFCGVQFMAETAKIVNPTKKVLIPALKAGCSLADGINSEDVVKLKKRFPKLPIVTYVNTSAAIKAESDVCCTSGNALKVVDWALKTFKTKSLIFIPDTYMAQNIAKEKKMNVCVFGRNIGSTNKIDYINDPTIISWDARCYVHEKYTTSHITAIRKDYPGSMILAHPECTPSVVGKSDFSGSTSAMIQYVEKYGDNKKIALLTECSMTDNILTSLPQYTDNLIRMCNIHCRYMHMITLEQLRDSLLYERYEVEVPEEIRKKAELAVKRMITIN